MIKDSNSKFNALITQIKREFDANDKAISLRIKRNAGFVAQVRSRIKNEAEFTVSEKLLDVIKKTYYSKSNDHKYSEIPLLEVSAQLPYTHSHTDFAFVSALPHVPFTPDVSGDDLIVFVIKDDAMEDGSRRSIIENDKVLCQEIPRQNWDLVKGVAIIIQKDGCICREVESLENEFALKSWNPIYNDKKVNIKTVLKVFAVKRIVDRRVR